MESQFHVYCGSRSTAQEDFQAIPAIDPDPPVRSWQFVGEFQQIMGENSEPDPLYFVESWTLGMSAAVENLQRRRHAQTDRDRKNRAREIDRFSPLSLVESGPGVDSYSASQAIAATESHGSFSRPPQRAESFAVRPEDSTPQEQEWQALAEEYDRNGDSILPMTQDRACQILGVDSSSTRAEIKAAYRRKVSQWHPDRLQRRTEKERKLATRQMAAINEAYHLLRTNPMSKVA